MIAARLRQQLADFDPALAVLLERERRRQQAAGRCARCAGSTDRRPLPGVLQQRGLGIEHVDLRRPARHEQDDVVLRLGRRSAEPSVVRRAPPRRRARRPACRAARPSPGPPHSDANQARGVIDRLGFMAKKSPRWCTAAPGRIARQRRCCPDSSAPGRSSFGLGSRASTRRYMAAHLRRRRPAPARRASPAPSACSWMNGLFMTNSCCSGVVVSSRSRAVHRRIGEIVEPQQRVQPRRG